MRLVFLILFLVSNIHGDKILKEITIPLGDVNRNEEIGQLLAVSKTNIEGTFDELVSRYSDNLRQRVGARFLSREIPVKEIREICGTSSSLICGNALVTSMGNLDTDTSKRCQARKTFLNCIDVQRKECNDYAENGYYPVLPPKRQISAIQENAWKTLWTSGACVLEA